MANRKEIRFMQKERMKHDGMRKVCDPKNYDSVNESYRSFFAMHWRNYPNLDIVPIVKKRRTKHTPRNLNVRKAAIV